MKSIEKVIVFNNAGLPIVMFDFSTDKITIDPMLISGFLAAITSFSQEMFKNDSEQLVIDSGHKIITLLKKDNIALTIISSSNVLIFKDKLFKLIDFFRSHYNVESDEIREEGYFYDFKLKVIRLLFKVPIALDWVPYWDTEKENKEKYIRRFPLLKYMDGKKSVEDIINVTKINKEKVYEILNYLSFYEHIKFKNTLELRDYIYVTTKFEEILADEAKYSDFKNEFKDINFDLINEMRQVPKLKSLQMKYGNKIVDVVKELYKNDLIGILDEDSRKIVLFIDILQDILNIIWENSKKAEILPKIDEIIRKIDFPFLINRINIKNDKIIMDKSFLNEIFREHKTLNININIWFKFVDNLINTFYLKKQKKFDEIMHKRLLEFYLPNCHNDEMEVLDIILEKLETLQK